MRNKLSKRRARFSKRRTRFSKRRSKYTKRRNKLYGGETQQPELTVSKDCDRHRD